MSVLGDSDAYFDEDRILSQHQSALTLLNARMQSPACENVRWLDFACGKGQLLSQLEHNLTAHNRQRITYVGYDVNVEHTKIAEAKAGALQLQSARFETGDACNLGKLLKHHERFDFITCTNALHEISPFDLPDLLVEVIYRLTEDGEAFIYDMESLGEAELGAVPIEGQEASKLFNLLLSELGATRKIDTSTWQHRTCKGWSVLVRLKDFGIDIAAVKKTRGEIVECIRSELQLLLRQKLVRCEQTLESYTKKGVGLVEDEKEKLSTLHEHWALHFALKKFK